jgi:hypothetical protein
MATRYAVANGNWSDTATWDGGTLPTSADDVYANNKTVTIDQDVTVISLRNAAVASPAITAGGTFQSQTSGTRVVNANVISAANGSVVTIVAGTVNFTLNGAITAGTNANSTFTMATYSFVSSSLSDYPTVTINGNITGGSVTNSEGVRHGGGSLYVTGTVRGGTGGNSCNGISLFNSNNIPTFTQINSGSALIGGTSTSGSTAALSAGWNPTGASIAPSSTIINCNLTGGASGSGGSGNAAYTHNTNSIPCTITGNVTGTLANRAIHIGSSADITINGNVYAASTGAGGSASESAIVHSSGGLLTVNGDLIGSTSGVATGSGCVYLNSSGSKYTQNGNIIGGNSTTQNYCFWSGNSGHTITINGNIIGGYGGSNSWGLRSNNVSPITINGNVTGGTGASGIGISNESSSVITLNGDVTAGTASSAHGYNGTGASSVLICNKLIANDGGPGAVGINSFAYAATTGNATSIVRFKKLQFGARGNTPISSGGSYQLIDDSINTATFYTSAANIKTLVDPNASGLMPIPSDVRNGISYASGNYTGTLIVPSSASVAYGVPVDSGIGTAIVSPQNIWDYMRINITGSGTIGERLKNAATIQSVGDQIAAF